MFSIEEYINCDLKPTETTNSPWLYEYNDNFTEKYPLVDGKWMQFYHKSELNTIWDLVKAKYRAGKLEGIESIKVSTVWDNRRASNSSDGVIIFYCGPSEDAEKVMEYGRKLLEEIPYRNLSGWMLYKSDEETSAEATGQEKDYLYRLSCEKS